MRLAVILMLLTLAVMFAMIFQAVSQELKLRRLKLHQAESAIDIKNKEKSLVDMKTKISELKTKMSTASLGLDKLDIKKAEIKKSTVQLDKSLESCNTKKAEFEKNKTDLEQIIATLKATHMEAKTKAEEDIKSLKQNILDRDKAICVFADTTKEEARKLCGISEAPK